MAPTLTLDWQESPGALPLFARIAESIARDVRRGRLAPGTRLPSSRALARSLGVHRNTVLAAFAELERQGYVETERARGTFVSRRLPEPAPRRVRGPAAPAPVPLELPPLEDYERFEPVPPRALALYGGLLDLRELPRAAWLRAYRAALAGHPQGLDYQGERGDPRLLRALAAHLAESRGVVAGDGELLVTRGSQLGLHLAARALARPGAVIAVEALGYRPAWEAFRLAGTALVPVPLDEHGLRVDELARLAARQRLAAVYLTPHHQFPTTVTLSARRRLDLLALAARHRFAILEDDYDHEHHFDGRPLLPLASADPARVVIHVGTFSKVLAPGLRVGYLVARRELVERVVRHRTFLDRQGDHVAERALALLIEDGALGAHLRKMRRRYAERREALFDALDTRLAGALAYTRSPGGLAVWARVARGISADAWHDRARDLGVLVQLGRRFTFTGAHLPWFRLGFARHTPAELREAVRRLAHALDGA